jgi:Flp pilus assembly protein TadD
VKADIARAEGAELHRRHDVARAEYERAIVDATDPQSIRYARREFAETLEHWGEVIEATRQLEAVIAIVPDDVASWNDLGVLYHNQGDNKRALAALERAKALAPRDWRPRRQLAMLLVVMHEYTRATAEYRAMLELDLPERLRVAVHKALDLLAAPPPSS